MNRGRPRIFNPEYVLESAMQLFWRKGYEATSLQDLLQATGLSKSSLYDSFGNKQSLFEAAFTRYFDMRAVLMREELGRAASPLAFIRNCLNSVLEDVAPGHGPRGCMLVNVANEFSTNDPSVEKLIFLATRRFREVFVEAFEQAKISGEVSQSKDPASLALFMHCAMSGLRAQVKSGIARKEILTVIEIIMANF